MSDTPILFLYPDAISAVLQLLPPPGIYYNVVIDRRYISSITSAGSKGYIALKDMLQNGVVGNTVLVESHDLRDLPSSSCKERTDVYFEISRSESADIMTKSTTASLTVYTNAVELPGGFLANNVALQEVDLSRLPCKLDLPERFLAGCTGLKTFDFSSMSHMTEIPGGFLRGCSGLRELDLTPLENLNDMSIYFVWDLRGLQRMTINSASKPLFDEICDMERVETVYV